MPQDVKFDIKARNRTDSAFDKVKKNLSGTTAGVAKLTGGLVSLLGIGAFGIMAKDALQMGDDIQKLNIRLGASTEALSQLRFVAGQTGVDFKTLTLGLQRANRRISEAALGFGEASGALKELGLDAKALNTLKPEQQFEAIADAMKGVENNSDKVRLSMKLFDTEGVKLLQTMEGGADNIRKMRKEADELGLTLSQEGADSIAKFNDQLARLKSRFEGLVQIVVVKLGPTLESLAEFFTAGIPQAINITIKAFRTLSLGLGVIVEKATSGLISFYDLLGKVPKFGEPYRKAAQDLRDFRTDLESVNLELAKSVLEAPKFTVSQGKPSDFAPLVEPEGLVIDRVKIDKDADKLAKEAELAKIKEEREVAALLATEERELESFSRRFESLELSMLSARELLEIDLLEKENLISEAIGRGIISEEQGKVKLLAVNARFQNALTKMDKKALTDRQKFEKLSLDEKIGFVAGTFKQITQIVGQESRAAFEISKAAAIADATINTYKAAVGAYSAMASIPYVGPALGVAAAAAAVVSGLANINSIRSQSFGGGGGPTPTTAQAITAPSSAPAPFGLDDTSAIAIGDTAPLDNSQTGREVTVNFVGGTFIGGSKDEVARELVPHFQKAIEDGVT